MMWQHLPLRVYLLTLKAITALLPLRWPHCLEGPGSARDLVRLLAEAGHRRVLVVSDAELVRLGLVAPLLEELERHGVAWALFDGVTPDPDIGQIEAGLACLSAHRAEALLAIGGGSPIDAAKLIGARARNRRPVRRLAGLFRIHRGMPPLYAIPTTAGTGSETTLAAVVSDPALRRKLAAVDPRLLPRATALDPELMVGLPAHITAATGMDALTHAVEAFLSRNALPHTDRAALQAAHETLTQLPRCVAAGHDLEARLRMARAAHQAGYAFTQAGVGYIHAIAHQLGAWYHLPHGLANAMVMPHLLEESLPTIAPRLASLARHCQVTTSTDDGVAAEAFIARVRRLNADFGIPERVAALRGEDIPALARAARAEVRFTYAVPRYLGQAELESLLCGLMAQPASAGDDIAATEGDNGRPS